MRAVVVQDAKLRFDEVPEPDAAKHVRRQRLAVTAVVEEQAAPIPVPKERVLLLGGILRRHARLGGNLRIAW